MSRFFGQSLYVFYILVCGALLFWWLPNFLMINSGKEIGWTYNYITASGILLALLLVVLIARQAMYKMFSLTFFMQFLLCSLSFGLTLYAFDFSIQANEFSRIHVIMTGFFTIWNFLRYRREIDQLNAPDDDD